MKNRILRFLGIIGGLIIMGGFFGVAIIAYFSFDLPKITNLADYRPPIHSQILAKDGTVLADVGLEKREVASMEEIPSILIDAFLSAEDSAFYEHKGVDYFGLLRALVANLKAGRVVQGGSTITQQVAKSLLLSSERSITRKIKDFLLAQKIEKRFSKKEILYLYLNQVYLGGGYYGVKAAFHGYFGKELAEASIAEAAMIAGLLVAPGRYSPYIRPTYAKRRQSYVLGRMFATGKITYEEYQAALNEQIKYRLRKKNEFKAGYFTDWVRQRVIELVGEDRFLQDGFRVHTTLDWDMQQIAEAEVLRVVKEIDKRQGYKGPHKHFETPEEILDFEKKKREEIIADRSQYFTIAPVQNESSDDVASEGDEPSADVEPESEKSDMVTNEKVKYYKKYEIEYDEAHLIKQKDAQALWFEEMKSNRFPPGNFSDDEFVEHLEKEQLYEAVVTKIDDWARIIYISIGGASGFIPYEEFGWAHERMISEEKNFYPRVTKPSTILKPGDIIWTEVKSLSASIWPHFPSDFQRSISKMKNINLLKNQKYLLCTLSQIPEVQGALFSIMPKSGEIVSMVGGSDFQGSQFNRAVQSLRQPGSSFKPFLYAAALENGMTPASIIIDSPEALGGADERLNWKPRNYDGEFKGPITFRNALEQSRNVPTIKIANELGVPKVLDFVARIGLDAKLEQDLSLALGTFGVTLLDIVSTYAIFPNGGKIVDAKSIISITDRDGNMYLLDENYKANKIKEREDGKATLVDNIDELEDENFVEAKMLADDLFKEPEVKENPYHVSLGGNQVYDPRLSYLMTNLLKGVVLHGTGRSAREVSHYLAGKTGTTNNYVDAWFIGFSSSLVTGVWTGFDNNTTLGWGETGAKAALPAWKEFMRAGIKKYGEQDFTIPQGIVHVLIDKEKGKISRSDDGFMEAFIDGTEPGQDSEDEVSPTEIETEETNNFLEEDEYYNNQ